MRIGVQIGPDRGRHGEKAGILAEKARAAEAAGFTSIWTPQIPDEFDAMTAATVMALATERIEIGTAVVPVHPRHPVSIAQQALSTQEVAGGRFTLGVGASHHWIVTDMLGMTYERPAGLVRSHVEVLRAALSGPGKVEVENRDFRVTWAQDITGVATSLLVAALAPAMLRLAGELTDGTILWMADEKAIGEHVVPGITAAAAGRPAPRIVAGVPVILCRAGDVDEMKAFADKTLAYAEFSPNYKRLLEHGNADRISDLAAIGDEETIRARLGSYRDAGVTDFNSFILTPGADTGERDAARERTLAFLGELAPEI